MRKPAKFIAINGIMMFVFCAVSFAPIAGAETPVYGNKIDTHENVMSTKERLSLARSFIAKMKSGLQHAETYLQGTQTAPKGNVLPEGETLLVQPVLINRLILDDVIFAVSQNKQILLSMRDFSSVLDLPLVVDAQQQTVTGWYIREDKVFNLDMTTKTVITDHGEFILSENVKVEQDDIFVPLVDLAQWIDFDFDLNISTQELQILSDEPLPIISRYNRRKKQRNPYEIPEVSLPRGDDAYKTASAPTLDVFTRSNYRKAGSGAEATKTHNASVRTSGDFAYGTVTTQSQWDNVEQLQNVRVNYKQESPDPELLGPLKARRFELGDVTTARLPLGGIVSQELGARVTNTDSLRTFTSPTTVISGTAFPGWDVELYRNDQLIGFQEVPDDGFYSFNDVDLFLSSNNFKIVFYGPQGEVHEEHISVPVNSQNLARGEAVYDVSLSLSQKNAYNKNTGNKDPDEGSLSIAALYEKPVLPGTTVSAGIRSNEQDELRNTVVNVGASTTVLETLVNGGIAVDDEGEMAAELTLRKDIKDHQIINTVDWRGGDFDSHFGSTNNGVGTLRNTFTMNGPLGIGIGRRPRYNLHMDYSVDSNDDYAMSSSAGFNTSLINSVTLNEQVQHSTSNTSDETLESMTNITGRIGKNRLRVGANYSFKPDSELRSVLATYRRYLNKKVDMEFGVTKQYESGITEYSANLDWQAGFIRLSPSVRYNSEQDFFAGLNTRFGIVHSPAEGRYKMFDRNLSSSGVVSAFVYLDKDGDGIFNAEDEPLEGVVVNAIQNGGRETTDENGLAMFTRMSVLKITDIAVDQESLQDPTWVTGFDGVSIVPREGNVVDIRFPVHISGEVDGIVYARAVPLPEDLRSTDFKEAEPIALRNVEVKLYNAEGELEVSSITDGGGFYYLPRVPPGRYLLITDEKSAAKGNFIRPEPQQIEIGYEGTIIYGNNIYVNSGSGDIPSAFLTDMDDYKKRHPHIDFSRAEHDLVLNLGEYNSRLLMSVVWYKVKSRYENVLGTGDLYVPPAESFADMKTGKHVLRYGLENQTIEQAYARCRALAARDQYCKVEIYPSYMRQAHAELEQPVVQTE